MLNSPQPAPTVSVGLPLHPHSPPCDFKQPGLSMWCSSLVWQGREPLTWLSPRSPAAGLAGTGPGAAAAWSLHWSQGPYCPEAISLLFDFSVSSTLSGLLSSYMLGYCWLFALFLSRSVRCFTHVQGEVDSSPTYLTAILVLHLEFLFLIYRSSLWIGKIKRCLWYELQLVFCLSLAF